MMSPRNLLILLLVLFLAGCNSPEPLEGYYISYSEEDHSYSLLKFSANQISFDKHNYDEYYTDKVTFINYSEPYIENKSSISLSGQYEGFELIKLDGNRMLGMKHKHEDYIFTRYEKLSANNPYLYFSGKKEIAIKLPSNLEFQRKVHISKCSQFLPIYVFKSSGIPHILFNDSILPLKEKHDEFYLIHPLSRLLYQSRIRKPLIVADASISVEIISRLEDLIQYTGSNEIAYLLQSSDSDSISIIFWRGYMTISDRNAFDRKIKSHKSYPTEIWPLPPAPPGIENSSYCQINKNIMPIAVYQDSVLIDRMAYSLDSFRSELFQVLRNENIDLLALYVDYDLKYASYCKARAVIFSLLEEMKRKESLGNEASPSLDQDLLASSLNIPDYIDLQHEEDYIFFRDVCR